MTKKDYIEDCADLPEMKSGRFEIPVTNRETMRDNMTNKHDLDDVLCVLMMIIKDVEDYRRNKEVWILSDTDIAHSKLTEAHRLLRGVNEATKDREDFAS